MGFAIDYIRFMTPKLRGDLRYDYLVYNFFKVGTWRFLIYDIRFTMFDLQPRSYGAIYELRCLLSGLYFFIFFSAFASFRIQLFRSCIKRLQVYYKKTQCSYGFLTFLLRFVTYLGLLSNPIFLTRSMSSASEPPSNMSCLFKLAFLFSIVLRERGI